MDVDTQVADREHIGSCVAALWKLRCSFARMLAQWKLRCSFARMLACNCARALFSSAQLRSHPKLEAILQSSPKLRNHPTKRRAQLSGSCKAALQECKHATQWKLQSSLEAIHCYRQRSPVSPLPHPILPSLSLGPSYAIPSLPGPVARSDVSPLPNPIQPALSLGPSYDIPTLPGPVAVARTRCLTWLAGRPAQPCQPQWT